MNIRTTLLYLSLLLTGGPAWAQTRYIQILHTNDLHASLETSGAPADGDDEMGGWAQVKATLDRLTVEAKAKGIESVRLDAGDFFEGTSNYFPNYGTEVLKIFQNMGYDATALGNHEWLMGARGMNYAFGLSPFSFPVLAANVQISPTLKNLSKQIVPTTQIIRDGIKIGVMGLTTVEPLYKWYAHVDSNPDDLNIVSYNDSADLANQLTSDLRSKNDVVIALTHIGFKKDKKLVENTRGLDLVIGGHSHTYLDQLASAEDPDEREVPIVQTGSNGNRVGKIMIRLDPGQSPIVETYELVPILHSGLKDANIEKLISHARAAVDMLYGPALNQPIGQTEARLVTGSHGPTAFSEFVVDAMRTATGSDMALDVGSFQGSTPQTAGNVSLRNLIEMYPRKFEESHQGGLYVYQTRVPGWALWLIARFGVKWGVYLSMSGLSYDIERISDRKLERLQKKYAGTVKEGLMTPYRATQISFQGEKICKLCSYHVAMSESLVRGAYAISPLTKLIMKDGHATPVTIWGAMTQRLKEIGTIQKLPATLKTTETENQDEGMAPWVSTEDAAETVLPELWNELARVLPHEQKFVDEDYDPDEDE